MKRVLVISLAAVLALCLSMVPVPANKVMAAGDWYVSPGESIQDKINAAEAASGGTVHVAAGTYYENIELKDGVEVVSDRTGDTIISGSSGLPVVTANGKTDAKLDGFTIKNGSGTQSGAGISIQEYSSNVTISNCVITGNTAGFFGGGIAIADSSATIVNCTVVDNDAGHNGGGIWVYLSSPTITNCISANNTALNDGGGIYVDNSPSANITHNDVWSNSPNNYGGITDQTGSNGNISQVPQFAGAGDHHLQSGSPCIDTGDNSAPNLPNTDKDGNARIADGDGVGGPVVDMGAYEAPAVIDTITVEIDIKPGSDPNSINPDSKGVIPVAILTTAGFDADTVDPTTVSFGPDEASPVHYALEDVDGDGDFDMILQFKTQDVGLGPDDEEATLTGQTVEGGDITGTDSVRIVPPKGKGKKGSNSNSGQGNGRGSGNGNSNPGQWNGQGNGNGNSNPGQGNGQGNGNGNSNPGQGNGQGNGNNNSNPGQGNGKGRDK